MYKQKQSRSEERVRVGLIVREVKACREEEVKTRPTGQDLSETGRF